MKISIKLVIPFVILAAFFIWAYKPLSEVKEAIAFEERLLDPNLIEETPFILVDPAMAPPDIREEVLKGYRIFTDTCENAPEYAGNRLSCKNCHFCGGNTRGGKNGSISLVGISVAYPTFSKRDNKMIAHWERIDNCFKRSLNGKPPGKDAPTMKALTAYLNWISSPVRDKKPEELTWMGLKELKTEHIPDPSNGAILYEKHCAACHLMSGEGTDSTPPLWGQGAFNDGAGMCNLNKIASFVHYNMPYMNPILTEEEAIDVSSYILKRPRPHFEP